MKLQPPAGVYSRIIPAAHLLNQIPTLFSLPPVKNHTVFSLASAALCAALFVGCSSPDSRIKDSPDVYARLNPDQQALVKNGQVAVGFEMDAVKLALGDPQRIVTRTTAAGQHQVWHYVTYEDYQGVVIYGGYWHRYRGWGGANFYGGVPYYNGYPARVHDRIRVEFDTNNRVESIEQDK
jgi:outer membrane protein assembly factor BamE (lipoprotein component of BamABCDE complex)